MLLFIYNASDDPIDKSQNGNIERKKIVQIGWVKMLKKQPEQKELNRNCVESSGVQIINKNWVEYTKFRMHEW